ncbi:MAG TPA: Asp-tRNA(Asn)/Glu-tRNA(Gln) amidotransferase subunit GatB [Gemmatimonadaceae bacterium]|nr:Asp-tRNA(Asn)/Glu-tRNA(Gln) amidotransferase subunit GatB [Gemmatimonadaceae bacterium]
MTATTATRNWTDKYQMVVGLEVHVQLKTATKIFCGCSTDFGAPPNSNTCPVCLALPGALPVLNEHAVELAIRAAAALGCTVNETSVFARKNYFYPDLPKGYQITQFDKPIASSGCVDIGLREDGSAVRIGVTRAHMEEDAGKSVHDRYAGYTAVDLNRAGVPLLEIVSEPEMYDTAQVDAYLRTLKQILEYTDVSDVNMEEGSLRVDANISVRERGETELGTKTELKNLNSFSNVVRALEVEFARQCAILDGGGRIEQQTMLWDEHAADVRPARSKEGSHDYRYFPEPDLPPLIIPSKWLDHIQRHLPELPAARRDRYRTEYPALTPYDVEVLTAGPAMGEYFEQVARQSGDGKAAANWMMGELMAALKSTGQSVAHFTVRPADLAQLIHLVRDDVVSHTAAKQIFATMVRTGDPPAQIAKRDNLLKVSDEGALSGWIDEVLAEHPAEAQRFLGGEKRLQGVLVGFVMKKSRGSADPKRVNQLLTARAGA